MKRIFQINDNHNIELQSVIQLDLSSQFLYLEKDPNKIYYTTTFPIELKNMNSIHISNYNITFVNENATSSFPVRKLMFIKSILVIFEINLLNHLFEIKLNQDLFSKEKETNIIKIIREN